MPSTDLNVRSVSCPGCGAHYDFPVEMSGQKGRCSQCGTKFVVPVATSKAAADKPSPQSPHDESAEPEYTGFECRVCQTRMYARVCEVGKKMKCPDCGALTIIPPPPPPKKKNIPAALEGEQYELWDADEAPLPSELAARQPQYIAVTCRKCATLMYAGEDQIGQSIKCPDCGTQHVVPAPPKTKPKVSVLAPDAVTPRLDPNRDPGERPATISPERQQKIDAEVNIDRTELGDKLDIRGRPIPPRWPLVTGIWTFPFYAGCRMRWFVLTLGLLGAGGLLVDGVPAWLFWQGDSAGAMWAMGGLAETLIGAVLFIVWLAAASNIFIAIVTESSEGHDHISKWPPLNFIDSMAEMLPVTVAFMFSAAPGWAIGHLFTSDRMLHGLLACCTLVIGFPVTLLSQLSGGATWDVIEPRVVVGFFRCPLSAAFFYIQSAILAAICVAATVAVVQHHALLALTLAPLYVACGLIYARLLGRLGLRMSQVMPPREEELAS
jgi:DNA-directed RNA polymerase subunit M/transcription elongation factor TFIIS